MALFLHREIFLAAGLGSDGAKPSRILGQDNHLEELKSLPRSKLEQAAVLVHGVREHVRAERLAALERSATILSAKEGLMLERAIAEGCGKSSIS